MLMNIISHNSHIFKTFLVTCHVLFYRSSNFHWIHIYPCMLYLNSSVPYVTTSIGTFITVCTLYSHTTLPLQWSLFSNCSMYDLRSPLFSVNKIRTNHLSSISLFREFSLRTLSFSVFYIQVTLQDCIVFNNIHL